MKVMIFVVDNLYDGDNDAVENFVTNDDLTKLYESWNKMYILSRSEEFSENDLEKFNVNTVNSLYSELRYNEEHDITDYQCETDFNIRKKS